MFIRRLVLLQLIVSSFYAQELFGQTPQVNDGGIVNAASYAHPAVLTPGVIFSVFGTSLSDGTTASANGAQLPTRLAGARLLVNGVAAPLFAASPSQIDAQFPVELTGLTSARIQVEVQSTIGTAVSPAMTVNVADFSPGIFTLDSNGSGPGLIVRTSDRSRICPAGRGDCSANPAVPGEVITISMNGLGAVTGPWSSGQAATSSSATVTTPVVLIGGVQAQVLLSRLAGGAVGLYQVDVIVPGTLVAGDRVSLSVRIGGQTSNQTTISIGTVPPVSFIQGGGPPGGFANAIAVDPSNHYTLYAAASSGVFKSINGGASWSASLTNVTVRFLAIDPLNPGTVYAAGNGIFKTTDGGNSWAVISDGTLSGNLSIRALAIDPLNTNILYVCGSGPSGGVFKTTDGGASWKAVNNGLTIVMPPFPRPVIALVIDPLTPSTVYVESPGPPSGSCVFKSTDAASSWSLAGCSNPAPIQRLLIDTSNPAILYGLLSSGVVSKSTDEGKTWTQLSVPNAFGALAIAPTGPPVLYAGTHTGIVFKSVDGGQNWIPLSYAADMVNINFFVIDPINPATLYAATSKGILKSTDEGLNWTTANNGITNASVSALAIASGSPDGLYVGTNNGAFKTTNGGSTWISLPGVPGTIHDFTIDPANSFRMYAGTGGLGKQDGVYKSEDGGTNWTPILNGNAKGVRHLAIAPTNSSVLYVTTGASGPFSSMDGGANWSSIVRDSRNSNVSALVIDPLNPLTIYTANSTPNSAGLFKSTDGGVTWNAIGASIPVSYVSCLTIDPFNGSTFYAGTSNGVFKSTDAGANWTAVNSGLPDSNLPNRPISKIAVTILVINPSNANILYAGTSTGGVFISNDGGASWTEANVGLTNLNITALIISATRSSTTLYAGTSGAGVFKSTDGGATWQPTGANQN